MRFLTAIALLASPVASGIESTVIYGKLRDPMEVAVAPDGDLIVVEREGRVLRIRPTTGGVFEIGHVEVSALRVTDLRSSWGREDGMLGVALDPEFATNQRLYLYYSHPQEILNRLSRFELKEGKLDPASEKVLLDIPTDRDNRVCHPGGSLAFGPDGLLYISTGDNTNPFEAGGYAPLDDREGRAYANAMRTAGNTNDLRGKILRIRPTEDGYEIPEGNLFAPGTEKTRPEIYVMGSRNPFRISIDPKKNILYWGDVGPDARSATARGALGVDELNQAKKAGNFGWPFAIADNQPYANIDYETGENHGMHDPAAPKNPRKNHDGLVDLPPAQPAFLSYPYSEVPELPALGSGGRNAMAGPVFYHDPERKYNLLGKEDDHTLLGYDWVRNVIWKIKLEADEALGKVEALLDGFAHPMDLEMAEDGTVWLLEYGSGWYGNGDGVIRRLRPSQEGNQPPSVTIVTEGTTYTATAEDPDGDELTIDWWLTEGADERKIGSGTTVTHEGSGSELRAVVTDGKGGQAIGRVPLVKDDFQPVLDIRFTDRIRDVTFDQEIGFEITGIETPEDLVVRVRYSPPVLGHEAGELRFPEPIEQLVVSRQCLACHQVDKPSVGPSYLDIAMRYHGRADAVDHLKEKLKTGGGGAWGEVVMPPQVAVSDEEADAIIRAVAALSVGVTEVRGTQEGTLRFPPAPEPLEAGGTWDISAAAPGHISARIRFPVEWDRE